MITQENLNSFVGLSGIYDLVSVIERCTDAFVFVYDFLQDTFRVSAEALEMFDFPSNKFHDAEKYFYQIIADEDKISFAKGLSKLKHASENSKLAAHYNIIDKKNECVTIDIRCTVLSVNGTKAAVGTFFITEKHIPEKITGIKQEQEIYEKYDSVQNDNEVISGFMILIGIDNINEISSRFGSDAASKIYEITASACKNCCGKNVEIFTFGESSFVIMNLDGGNAIDMRLIFTNISSVIEEFQSKENYKRFFTISAGGIAFFKDKTCSKEIVNKLIFAFNEAKKNGLHKLNLYNAWAYSLYLKKLELLNGLEEAVNNNFSGFSLYYQPIIDAKKLFNSRNLNKDDFSQFVIGAEALIRWKNKGGIIFEAADIVPLLEESGLMTSVGKWIVRTAFKQCKKWNIFYSDFQMSINISQIQLEKGFLTLDIWKAINDTDVNPENIVLEISESSQLYTRRNKDIFSDIYSLKIKIDIDNFGKGYSNLQYIQDIRANSLKINNSFIPFSGNKGKNSKKILEYISDSAHESGIMICIGGIESYEELEKLIYIKPDKLQGYLFGYPKSAEDFERENLSIGKSS